MTETATGLVNNIYEHLNNLDFKQVEKALKFLLLNLQLRGIMTILGFRKTVGS